MYYCAQVRRSYGLPHESLTLSGQLTTALWTSPSDQSPLLFERVSELVRKKGNTFPSSCVRVADLMGLLTSVGAKAGDRNIESM